MPDVQTLFLLLVAIVALLVGLVAGRSYLRGKSRRLRGLG